MEGKTSFVFYETFLDSVKCLPEEEQTDFIHAIIDYGLYEVEPVFEGAKQGLWLMIKNGIDNCKERRLYAKKIGSKGGRSKKVSDAQAPLNQCLSTAQAENNSLNLKVNLNENENENENENVNVNEGAKAPLSTSTDGNKTKLTSDAVREHLQAMGYDINPVSCGTIASLLNFNNFPLEYCEFVENKVSDKYPEISPPLMVNALTTWTELYDEFRKMKKAKEKKKEEKHLSECVVCGEKLDIMNWINGKYNAYFCTNCHTNFVKQKDGTWQQNDEL